MNTDETRIQKIRRLYSTLARPKFINILHLGPGRFQLVEQLGFVALVVLRSDLDFNDYAVIDNQIRIVIADNDTFVLNLNLSFRVQPLRHVEVTLLATQR